MSGEWGWYYKLLRCSSSKKEHLGFLPHSLSQRHKVLPPPNKMVDMPSVLFMTGLPPLLILFSSLCLDHTPHSWSPVVTSMHPHSPPLPTFPTSHHTLLVLATSVTQLPSFAWSYTSFFYPLLIPAPFGALITISLHSMAGYQSPQTLSLHIPLKPSLEAPWKHVTNSDLANKVGIPFASTQSIPI